LLLLLRGISGHTIPLEGRSGRVMIHCSKYLYEVTWWGTTVLENSPVMVVHGSDTFDPDNDRWLNEYTWPAMGVWADAQVSSIGDRGTVTYPKEDLS
jgi:hypothetical protein